MPRHCSAGGCKSRDTRESRKAGITFHKLPKGTARRNLWINQSHRDGLWEPQTDFVYFCSKHFTPESFELIGYSGIRRIREDAYPTLFEVTPEVKRKGRPRKQTNSTKTEPPTIQEAGREETEEEALPDQGEEAQQVPSTNGSTHDAAVDVLETDPKTTSSSQAQGGPSEEAADDSSQQQQGGAASPPSSPRPVSPSRYMRRLPPPPGFHLPKEHSYAQICPLVWRRRYDRAIDCLEKALRQLNAARRRENRLRGSLLRLREKRLKHTLLTSSRDRPRGRGGRTPPPGRALFRGEAEERLSSPTTNPDENDTDVETEDINNGLFATAAAEGGELGEEEATAADLAGWIPTTTTTTADTKQQGSGEEEEEERGYCFYCGRGREDGGGGGGHAAVPRGPKTTTSGAGDGQTSRAKNKRGAGDDECDKRTTVAVSKRPAERKFRKKPTRATEREAKDDGGGRRFASSAGKPGEDDIRVVVIESQRGGGLQPPPAPVLHHPQQQQQSQVHVDLQQMMMMSPPAAVAHHFTTSPQQQPDGGPSSSHGMLLAESSAGGGVEHVGWIEGWIEGGAAEGQLFLIPVPDGDYDDRMVGLVQTDDCGGGAAADEDMQTIVDGAIEIPLLTPTEVGFESDRRAAEGDEGRCSPENVSRDATSAMAADDLARAGRQCSSSGTPVVMREDLKEKLKEHLEGFQLQLSNEFID